MDIEKVEGLEGVKLVIATPFYEVKGFSPYISSLAQTILFLSKHTDVDVDFWELAGDSYVERARNSLAKQFLNSDRTHMFFIDSDHSWNITGFMRVLMSPGRIVGAGYPCKNTWDFYGCILNTHEDGRPIVSDAGLLSAHVVPTGFMCIHRSVFEQLLPFVEHREAFSSENDPQKEYGFFDRIPPLGEDGSFNMRCEQNEIPRWVQPDVDLVHYGTQGWPGNYHEWLQRLPGGSQGPALEENSDG